jgi:hypothetical protein
VENLDSFSQNLSISLWSGHASIKDLKLKNDLFEKMNLPFKMKLGIIKKLELEIPFMRLSSQPVVAKID